MMLMTVEETQGQLIKRLRTEKNISQRELSKIAGIDLSYLNQLEQDKAGGITLKMAKRIANALDIDPGVFLANTIEKPETKRKPLKDFLLEFERKMEAIDIVEVPICGSVPAGYPDLIEEIAIEDVLEVIKSDLESASNPSKVFALRITGESLIGDGIMPDDYVLVDPVTDIIPGKIYVVRVGNETTVKHITPQNGKVLLTPSNDKYPIMELKEIEILGRVFLSVSRRKH